MLSSTNVSPAAPQSAAARKSNAARKSAGIPKALWIIPLVIVLVLLAACALVYVFRMPLLRLFAPEIYTQMAVDKTLTNARERAGNILDLTKYEGESSEHTLAYDTDHISTKSTLQYDPENEEALAAYSFDAYGISYDDNRIYISPDLIAVSVPSIAFDADYLTVDPVTFADDWKERGWDQVYEVPDLERLVHGFFGNIADESADEPGDSTTWPFLERVRDLASDAEFTSDGSVREAVGGDLTDLDVMTYILAKEDVAQFYEECPFIESRQPLAFKEDIVLHLYIDRDGLVRKIQTEDFAVTDEGKDKKIRIAIELAGDQYPADVITAVLTKDTGGTPEVAQIDLESDYADGIYTAWIKIINACYTKPFDSSVSVDIEWDKNDTSGPNLTIEAAGRLEGYDYTGMMIAGDLTDSSEGTDLYNGSITLTDDFGHTTGIDFNYSAAVASNPDISIDLSDSTPLLEYLPFQIYMGFAGVFD